MPKTRRQIRREVNEILASTPNPSASKYDTMTGEQLSKLPPNGKVYRAAYGTPGKRNAAQAANWARVLEYNSRQPGGLPGIGPFWNS